MTLNSIKLNKSHYIDLELDNIYFLIIILEPRKGLPVFEVPLSSTCLTCYHFTVSVFVLLSQMVSVSI